jgi:hypothetical protein
MLGGQGGPSQGIAPVPSFPKRLIAAHLYILCAEGKNRTLAQAEGGCLREARLAGFGSWGSKTSVFRGVFGMETEKPLVPRRLTSGVRVVVRRGAEAART